MLVADVKMPGMERSARLSPDQGDRARHHQADHYRLWHDGDGPRGRAPGVRAFILKPFGPDELCAAVARALDGRRLARENARLRALLPVHELTRALMATTDLDSLSRRVVELAARETGAEHASLLLVDAKAGALYLAATHGREPPPTPSRLRIGEGIAGWVARTGEQLALQGTLTDDGRAARFEAGASTVCLPIVASGRAVGMLNRQAAGNVPFSRSNKASPSRRRGVVAIESPLHRPAACLQAPGRLDHRKNSLSAGRPSRSLQR